MWQAAGKFIRSEEGASAVEYGLIASLIAVAIVTTVTGLGGKLNEVFTSISNKLKP